jgi:hypothetical protein
MPHVQYRLQGGSPWSLSINRINNAKGIGYPIDNVEVNQPPLDVCFPLSHPTSDAIAGHNPRSESSRWQFAEDQDRKYAEV